ncbi:MAG: HEPN domain-containing protein [Betaproteobacteria bacterium]|nr:HEPN domain-containing protein [Betaproteobacteria bacterium]
MAENGDRRIIEGWIDKARNQLQSAKQHLESRVRWSESVEASQESVELSVKAILSLLQIEFPLTHGWNNEALARIADQIQKRQLLLKLRGQNNLYWAARLPRLLLLTNFWAQFYLPAKYGMEAGRLAPPQDLFEEDEAKLAVQHAEECYRAVSELRYLDENKLAAIVRK